MKKVTLLLAEDDSDDIEIFFEFLKRREDISIYPVAKNGEEALFFLDNVKQLPDLVILDHNMPRMSGSQALKLLKENPKYAHIPVVVYSTYADNALVENCLQAGAALVVSKPLTEAGYNQLIDTCINIIGPV